MSIKVAFENKGFYQKYFVNVFLKNNPHIFDTPPCGFRGQGGFLIYQLAWNDAVDVCHVVNHFVNNGHFFVGCSSCKRSEMFQNVGLPAECDNFAHVREAKYQQ